MAGISLEGGMEGTGRGAGRDAAGTAGRRRRRGRFTAAAVAILLAAGCAAGGRVAGPASPGALAFAVRPPEAEVVIDGSVRGQAREWTNGRVLEVSGGTHRLELRLPGYEPYARDVFVAGGVVKIDAVLFPAPPPDSGY